jgi:hypothetical protein
MGLRYRKRVTLFPGFAVNIGKSGITSASIGGRGAHYTVGRRGPRVTVGVPGTGLSYTASTHHGRRRRPAVHHSIGATLLGLFVLYVLFRVLTGL